MKDTIEIVNKITNRDRNDTGFLNDTDLYCPQIHYYLADLLRAHEVSNSDYIKALNLERSYGYQLLNGRRKPSREHLVQTAILLHLGLEETQRLLKIGHREVLYPRVKKDAIAVFAIDKRLDLSEYQELIDAYEKEF